MAAMRAPHRGNPRCMPRHGQPVVNGGTNSAALQRWIAAPLVAGDQQQNPVTGSNSAIQRMVDGGPGSIQSMAVEIEHPVRLDPPGAEAAVPAAVECRRMQVFGTLWRYCCRPRRRHPAFRPDRRWLRGRERRRILEVARQRTDRRRYLGPECGFLRGQAAHGRPPPWAATARPRPWPPFRLPSDVPFHPRPRRCRSGWRP